MWDELKQARLDQLHGAEAKRELTKAERAELAELVAMRCLYEEEAIRAATRKNQEQNRRIQAQINQVEAQNRTLEALIQEQESYLAEVQSLLTQMQARRQDWRKRYHQVTGRPLNEALTTEAKP